jgi:anhydro-N-acetylmuramic acid kinase
MTQSPKSLIVAGIMSGTSADGIDVALCRISPGHRKDASPRIKLLGHHSTAYPRAVRAELLRIMEGAATTAADLSRLNWRLGALYADAVEDAAKGLGIQPSLIGLHGQTIHHQPTATRILGAPVRSTWQIGEPAVVAERLRCPVVSDLRPADLAAGGQGAPLVPMLDWCLFRSSTKARVLLNLGGIANLTAIPAAGSLPGLIAFDTGPANMVIDACMAALYNKPLDRNGATARRGRVLAEVVARILRDPYFSAPPPKSCGREQFGAAFSARFLTLCRDARATNADIVATATALTADSIAQAYQRFVAAHVAPAKVELLAAGGGAHNPTLIALLRERFTPLGVALIDTQSTGIPAQAKEAVAFALLAWLTWHGQPGNVPAATGATHPAILGKVSLG